MAPKVRPVIHNARDLIYRVEIVDRGASDAAPVRHLWVVNWHQVAWHFEYFEVVTVQHWVRHSRLGKKLGNLIVFVANKLCFGHGVEVVDSPLGGLATPAVVL